MPTSPLLRPGPALSAGLLLCCLAFPADADAQKGADLAVTVTDAENGEPLQGVRVTVEGSDLLGTTNAGGKVRLLRVPAGQHTVELSMLGRMTVHRTVRLRNGEVESLEVPLPAEPVSLDPVEAASRQRPLGLRMLEENGFFRRKTGGSGTFLTREDIRKSKVRQLSDLFRRHLGFSVSSHDFDEGTLGSSRSPGQRCTPMFFLDGVPAQLLEIDNVRPTDLEGLEIYRGPAQVPPEFNKYSATCGVVVLWTRVD